MTENATDELALPVLVFAYRRQDGIDFLALHGVHSTTRGVVLVAAEAVFDENVVVRAMQGRRGWTCYDVNATLGGRFLQLAAFYGLNVVQVKS